MRYSSVRENLVFMFLIFTLLQKMRVLAKLSKMCNAPVWLCCVEERNASSTGLRHLSHNCARKIYKSNCRRTRPLTIQNCQFYSETLNDRHRQRKQHRNRLKSSSSSRRTNQTRSGIRRVREHVPRTDWSKQEKVKPLVEFSSEWSSKQLGAYLDTWRWQYWPFSHSFLNLYLSFFNFLIFKEA